VTRWGTIRRPAESVLQPVSENRLVNGGGMRVPPSLGRNRTSVSESVSVKDYQLYQEKGIGPGSGKKERPSMHLRSLLAPRLTCEECSGSNRKGEEEIPRVLRGQRPRCTMVTCKSGITREQGSRKEAQVLITPNWKGGPAGGRTK